MLDFLLSSNALALLALLTILYSLPKQAFFSWYMQSVLGWTLKGTMPTEKHAVFACYPHTSGWDMFYGMFLVYQYKGGRVMVKDSLAWMKILGLPLLTVSRGANARQTETLASDFKTREHCKLWIWISGTRNKSDYISSGFYYIARDAGVPIVFGSLDYRTKEMIPSRAFDARKMTKEEILAELRKFSDEHDLKGAGYVPGNASTLAFRESKKKA